MSLFYYSTNSWIKWYVCSRWRSDRHYVWCSEVFDPAKLGATHFGSLIPQTSSPCAIYEDLARAVRGTPDRHNSKIVGQRGSLTSLAEEWRRAGEISDDDANEIIALLAGSDFHIWRPLLYIIPKTSISPTRVERVPLSERAGIGDEFRIKDLSGTEFEWIEFNAI